MTNTETVSTERLANALAELTDCFLEKHGCFPIDNKRWNAAMTEAYALVGQPGTHTRTDKLSTFTAHTQPPAEWQVEAAARVLVPVWYGGFEDQTQKEEGGWLHPPGTPNKRALDTARDVLRAASIPAPERSKEETLRVKAEDGPLMQQVMGRFQIYQEMAPEEDETWESWYYAALDMLRSEVREILSALETPPLHKEGEDELVIPEAPKRVIGTIAHIDHGKTSLTAAVTRILAAESAAPAPVPVTIDRVTKELERMDAAGDLTVYEMADDRGLTIEEYADLFVTVFNALAKPGEQG